MQRPFPGFRVRRDWLWLTGFVLLAVVFWKIHALLWPFLLGGIFAYVCDPFVDWFQRKGVSRTLGTVVVFLVAGLIIGGGLALLIPLLVRQVQWVVASLPGWMDVVEARLPAWGITLPEGLSLDTAGIRNYLSEHWQTVRAAVSGYAVGFVGGGLHVAEVLANLALVPFISFYLLRDWDHFIGWLRGALPRHWVAPAKRMADEVDSLMMSFLKGQFLVMLTQGMLYYIGLRFFVGLNLALLVAFIAGLVSFVPYVGFMAGAIAGSVAAVAQFQTGLPVLYVLMVFAAGSALEGSLVAPLLMGRSISIHPVWIIFAIMMGGYAAGLVGMMAALPTAAILSVLARHIMQAWYESPLYHQLGRPEAGLPDADTLTADGQPVLATPPVVVPPPAPEVMEEATRRAEEAPSAPPIEVVHDRAPMPARVLPEALPAGAPVSPEALIRSP